VISWIAALVCLHGAFDGSFPAAAVVGRGGPDAAFAGEGDPLEANPALASQAAGTEAGAGWTRPLDLAGVDLSGFWAHALAPWGTGLALRWRNLSASDIYREDLGAVDVAQTIGPFGVGGGWRWGRMEIAGRSQGNPLGWTAGATATPVEAVRLGAAWEDLSGLRPDGLPQPWTIRSAVSVRAADSSWNADMGGELRQRGSWTWHAGQELRLDPFRLRLGLRVSPWTLCAGMGGIWKGVMVDYALEDGPNLGLQHHGTVSWRW